VIGYGLTRHGCKLVLRSRKSFLPASFVIDLRKDQLCHGVLALWRESGNGVERFLEQIRHELSFLWARYWEKISLAKLKVNAVRGYARFPGLRVTPGGRVYFQKRMIPTPLNIWKRDYILHEFTLLSVVFPAAAGRKGLGRWSG
jgi:hypothetical protein